MAEQLIRNEQVVSSILTTSSTPKTLVYQGFSAFSCHEQISRFSAASFCQKSGRFVECVKFTAEKSVSILFSYGAEDLNKDVVKFQSAQEQDESFDKARRVLFRVEGQRLGSVVDHKRLRQANAAFA